MMDDNSNEDSDILLDLLLGASWHRTSKGGALDVPSVGYQGNSIYLEIELEGAEILFSISDQDGRSITLYLVYETELKTVLRVIVAFQDLISPDNIRACIAKVVAVCPEVWFAMDDDNFVRLEDDLSSL